MTAHDFLIPVDLNIDLVEKRFDEFLVHLNLDKAEREEVIKSFGSTVLPNIERMQPLTKSGSNIDYSKSITTSKGEVVVRFDSARKGILIRILSAFRR